MSNSKSKQCLFLDDFRGAPVGWTLVRTVDDFVRELKTGKYVEASLDFDLADPHCSGTFAASAIVEAFQKGECSLKNVTLHSANRAGRQEMYQKLRKHTTLEVVSAPLEQPSVAFIRPSS